MGLGFISTSKLLLQQVVWQNMKKINSLHVIQGYPTTTPRITMLAPLAYQGSTRHLMVSYLITAFNFLH